MAGVVTGGVLAAAGNALDGGGGGGGGQLQSALFMNSYRIAYLAEKLLKVLDSKHDRHRIDLSRHLCFDLARGIDSAVCNNDVPSKAQELPVLLKKVCQHKDDVLQTAIMVLMISVKIACKFEWFSKKDTEELLTLAKEIQSRFCNPGDINSEPCQSLSTVSNVMARFCPQMKTGQILASLNVNPGYGAYLVDFHISKNEGFSPNDTIRLFVGHTDNMETSSCIIRPPQVNFLLNGRGVSKKRTKDNILDTGPQFPTDVTVMCMMGANLLQVLGQFNGHYLIVIASMSVTSTAETPLLQDYVQPEVAAHDSDTEIIEGASRTPLNCPISGKRINTPVKGHSCKHLQCFDLDNYVKINMSNPFWRCPCCNRTISYLDIRIDQYMVKVLREVGENVAYVTIFEDGSWKAGSKSNERVGQLSGKTTSCQQDGSLPQEPTYCSDALPMVFDLTNGNDETDLMSTSEIEDRKPSQANPQSHSIATTLPMQSELNITSSNLRSHSSAATPTMTNTCQITNQASIPQLEDDFWSGFFLPSSTGYDAQNVGGIAEPSLAHSIMSNELGTFPSVSGHVIESLQSVPQKRSRTSLNSSPTAACFNTLSSDTQRQQQYSRSFTSPMSVSEMASSSVPHHSMTQNRDHQGRLFISSQPVQQVTGFPVHSQLSGPYGQSYGIQTELQYSHQQQTLNQRIPQNNNQPPNAMMRPRPYPQQTHMQQVGTQPWLSTTTGSGNPFIAASQRATQMARPSQHSPVHIQATRTGAPLPVNSSGYRASVGEQRGNVGGTMPPVTTAEGLVDLSSERNWQPTGRMRGSLLGHAYSAALNEFTTWSSQPTQATRPPANPTSFQPVVPPQQLQVLLANNRNAHAGQTQLSNE